LGDGTGSLQSQLCIKCSPVLVPYSVTVFLWPSHSSPPVFCNFHLAGLPPTPSQTSENAYQQRSSRCHHSICRCCITSSPSASKEPQRSHQSSQTKRAHVAVNCCGFPQSQTAGTTGADAKIECLFGLNYRSTTNIGSDFAKNGSADGQKIERQQSTLEAVSSTAGSRASAESRKSLCVFFFDVHCLPLPKPILTTDGTAEEQRKVGEHGGSNAPESTGPHAIPCRTVNTTWVVGTG
jgi:hypothetical protein